MIFLGDIECNVVRHCNFACTACNHGSAIAPVWFMQPESLAHDLAALAKVAHWKFFCLQGGEPLLNKRIVEFMDVARQSGIADQVGLLTNGSLLPRMTEAFWRKSAEISLELRVSRYPRLEQLTLDYAAAKCAEYGVTFKPHETTTFLKIFAKHEDKGQRVWDHCPWKRCWTVHEGHLAHCPQAMFFPEQFPHRFDSPPAKMVDAVPIAELTEAKLCEMLSQPSPLRTCAICTGGDQDGKIVIPWSEERKPADWELQSTV